MCTIKLKNPVTFNGSLHAPDCGFFKEKKKLSKKIYLFFITMWLLYAIKKNELGQFRDNIVSRLRPSQTYVIFRKGIKKGCVESKRKDICTYV